LVWIDNPPPKEEMRRHYGSKYDSAIAAAGDAAKKWYGRRETLMKFKPGGTILDLGCSSGAFLATLDSSNWKLFGIEMSGAVASRASAINDAEVYVGDILSAPFPDHSFDAGTCLHVFEHLYNPQQVMSRVARWLKPGGILYMMVPNIDSAGAKTFKSYWYALELPRHLFQFSPASLRVLASRVGLNEVSLVTVREPFIEASTRYVVDDLLRRVGLTRKPLAEAGRPTFLWRIARKAFRITILPILNSLVSTRGDGESIHAIFAKPTAT
jgi:SAM-dependent methyltransferase